MLKLKSLLKNITDNIIEIWLAALLFVGLPYVVALYTDWRGFVATSLILQTTVLVLYIYKGIR